MVVSEVFVFNVGIYLLDITKFKCSDIYLLNDYQFRVQSTVNGVAQTVVDKVVRKHHDMYMSCDSLGQSRRDDITLLVRNFNFPMPCAGGRGTVYKNIISTMIY